MIENDLYPSEGDNGESIEIVWNAIYDTKHLDDDEDIPKTPDIHIAWYKFKNTVHSQRLFGT